MQESVFTRIIKGEIPSHKVYEDEKTIAFMDINPVQTGMVLIVPKIQIDHFMELPDDDYRALMVTLKKVSLKMHEVFPDKRVGVQIEGLDVPHAHIKVFPIASADDFRKVPNTSTEPNHPALAQMANKLQIT